MGTQSSAAQRTLVLVKPDGMHRALAGEIVSRFEQKGLRIAGIKLLQVTEELAGRHYEAHKDKPFFGSLVDFITSCPIVAMVLEGKNAIEIVRQTMGQTDPAKAAPGTIRGDLAMDIQNNLVHGSDSPDAAKREIGLFFAEGEVLSYTRCIDSWLGMD